MFLPPRTEVIAIFARHRTAVLAALPHDMATIAGRCGFATLLRLVSARGGTRMQISAETPQVTSLSEIVGKVAARRISEEFAGTRIDIMSPSRVVTIYRSIRGPGLIREGRGTTEIARALGVTYRAVERYRKLVRGGCRLDR